MRMLLAARRSTVERNLALKFVGWVASKRSGTEAFYRAPDYAFQRVVGESADEILEQTGDSEFRFSVGGPESPSSRSTCLCLDFALQPVL